MDEIGFEIEFLPVGNGERSGDAILVRYGVPGDYKIMVYDGGTKESGQKIVDHVRTHYDTDYVDYVVNSHPDGDHASGLSVVLEQLEVGELWMHKPWDHSDLICDYFVDGRITSSSLAERLKAKMGAAHALEKLAEEKGIPTYEPFQGSQIGEFHVCSPEKEWYVHDLIKDFEKSPEQKAVKGSSAFAKFTQKVVSWISERWDFESLREDVETSAENESSVILYAFLRGEAILLTGDAGVEGLSKAADLFKASNIDLPSILRFVQVPHHGSRNNVSTSVLDRLVGPRTPTPTARSLNAFVSASPGSTTHPRKAVVNAFIRRGAKVVATHGETIRSSRNMPARDGWQPVTPLSFSDRVEDWD